MQDSFVSILMLTHNAPEYVELAIRSVSENTKGGDYELIVVDNASESPTRDLITRLHNEGLIHKMKVLDYNSLFAHGNNVAASLASSNATHYLLLNSDVQVKSDKWLSNLLSVHHRGVTAYGVAPEPLRVDGFCLLIDAELYRDNPLDEGLQWWWGVSKQQAKLLCDGLSVQGYGRHEKYIHHFGGKSGSAFRQAQGMDVGRDEVLGWFDGKSAYVIDRKANGQIPGHETSFLYRLKRRGVKDALRMQRRIWPRRDCGI